MNRFESAILILLCASAIGLAVPISAYASIEVDEEEVVFRFEDTGAVKIFLTGDFNNWNPKMDSMVKRGGAWELRLYLVPGRYRYMFVVDGENVPDPDNPNRDGDGNTFFIFVEEEGTYSIIYEVTETGERKIEERYTPYGALAAVAVEDYGLFTASAGVEGEIDGSLRGNILIGAEYETIAEQPIKAYLVRAKGEWVTEKFSLGAFHRSGTVGFDDPLSLFTDVGPYAYPLDLFCRGAEASIGWKNSIEGRIFFANRIDGYEFERFLTYPNFRESPEDKDMIGASLKGLIKPVRLEYLFRYDRGPGGYRWEEEGMELLGAERRTSHGLLLGIEKQGWPSAKVQYLTGNTTLNAYSVVPSFPLEQSEEISGFETDWEEGYRAFAGISWKMGSFVSLFNWHRTTIERNAEILDYSVAWDDAGMDIFKAGTTYENSRMMLELNIDYLSFTGSGGLGRTFWIQGQNFWLDGNQLRTELIQFMDSKSMWRVAINFEENGVDSIPGPFRLEGYFSARSNWDNDEARSMIEISGGKGVRAGSYLSLHADMRYVSYNDDRWVGENSFLDFWAGLRGNLGGSGWAALGVGVAPHRFDRWYFDFTGDGRESYLIDQGFFSGLRYWEEREPIEALSKAEQSLAEDWRISFEGGFSF